jgi:hypothetical protein
MTRQPVIVLLSAATLIMSCGQAAEERTNNANHRETMEVIEPLPQRVYNSVSIKRHFSSDSTHDIFTLELSGETYHRSELVFTITRSDGDTLFIRRVKGNKLMAAHASGDLDTETKKEEYILQFMSTFFAETSFSSPPYTLNDPRRDDFKGNMELWEQIREDTTAWCFEFSLGKEGTELIAYSDSLDTIIVYDAAP